MCDAKGKTVTVARVNDLRGELHDICDRIVGGFTSVAWSTDFDHHDDDTAFVFCNRNDVNHFERYSTKYTNGVDAVMHNMFRGPCFSADLVLLYENGVDHPTQSYCSEMVYRAVDGSVYDSDTLVGPHGAYDIQLSWRRFRANEIEVFAVV